MPADTVKRKKARLKLWFQARFWCFGKAVHYRRAASQKAQQSTPPFFLTKGGR